MNDEGRKKRWRLVIRYSGFVIDSSFESGGMVERRSVPWREGAANFARFEQSYQAVFLFACGMIVSMAQSSTKLGYPPILGRSKESREVVFAPNLKDSPTFGNVYKSFMRDRGKKLLKSWTCKKTAKPGDLYLFYFGEPERKIAGLAVCREPPDQDGWKHNKSSRTQKMFFCSFDQLHHFKTPLEVDELRSNSLVNLWWRTRPYHGRPKIIPAGVASELLRLVSDREPRIARFLSEYISECGMTNAHSKRDIQADALEGTVYERLVRQSVRNKALRDTKIREVLLKNGRLVCEVRGCGFDFFETYGELGRGFAHVHHRKSLANRKTRRTKPEDLAIVCANCHAMIHRWRNCRSLHDLISK